ncbi:MAG: ABC-type Na+ efflux pump permease subunit [Psychroserpens sp.]|jgi:ABC-type Na+ efflux pump permease subunit
MVYSKLMEIINKYSKFVPYLYFLAVIAYWFTDVNQRSGLTAYPILLFGIPFLFQIFKPNRKLNFTLGITFVCLSSYMIVAYLSDVFNIVNLSEQTKQVMVYGGIFVIANFVMALWMIRNSLDKSF